MTNKPDLVKAEAAARALLESLGEDMTREGMRDTPRRMALALAEMCTRQEFAFTTFASEGMSELIIQEPIPMASLCEHHSLPFVGTAILGYIPRDRIVGLSKLARAVKYCSRGFQNQERITQSIANMLDSELQPQGVGVVVKARHLCMELRGACVPGVFTTTSCLRGALLEDGRARNEFLRLAGR